MKLRSPERNEVYGETISKTVRLEDRGFPKLAKDTSGALAEGIEQIQAGIANAIPDTR